MRKSILLLFFAFFLVLGRKHSQRTKFDVATLFDADQARLEILVRNGTQILTEMLRDPFYQDFVRGIASQGKEVVRMIDIPEIRKAVQDTANQIYNFTEIAIQKVVQHLEGIVASKTPFIEANEALYDLEAFLEKEIYNIQDTIVARIDAVKASHMNRLNPDQLFTLQSLLEMFGVYQQTTTKVLTKGIRNAQFFIKTISLLSIYRDERRLQTLETELRDFANSVLPTLKAVNLTFIKKSINDKIELLLTYLNRSINNTAVFLEKLELEAEPGVKLAQIIDSSHGNLVEQMFNFRNQANLDLKDLLGRIFSFLRIEGVDTMNALQISRRIFSSLQVESQRISDIIIEGIMLQELKLIYGDELI